MSDIPSAYWYVDWETDENIDLCPDLPDDWPWCGMAFFWLGWKDWLAARGYTLTLEYRRGKDINPEWIVPPSTAEAQSLPYARRLLGKVKPQEDIKDARPGSKIGYAQDRYHRDIVIKITPFGSEEHRAYQRLLDCTRNAPPNRCCGVLRPVAILEIGSNFAFVAMPRWGDVGHMDAFKTVAQGIQFMRCVLEGLAHLHDNRIVHRDIIDDNMLVNCYNLETRFDLPGAQESLDCHRSATDPSDVHYCLFDFDICHIFPLDAPLQACRRPADEAWAGAPSYQPDDVWRGEHDYDPFAYDVACLGYFLVVWLGSLVSVIPLLAPLFDKMNTHIIADRFTASEAARFFEEIVAQTPQSVLDTPMTMEQQKFWVYHPDLYWSQKPPEFRARWASFRMPPRSWFKQALLRVATNPVGWPVLQCVRTKLRI
ncbi:hypothetical protein C8Q77DRAFT_1136856 [Trametes polyzona]|nr:hypothetical protein C8Q77DRAFT_1136856 [Trametes polyzona]